MKKLTGILILLALAATSAHASLGIGLSLLFDNNDLGSELGFAPRLNWQFTDNDAINHSIEAEIGFLNKNGTKTVSYVGGTTADFDLDGRAMPLLLNYRLGWNPSDVFGLYAGAGVGLSFNSIDWKDGTGNRTQSTSAFAWQIQVGSNLTFAENYNVNLGYRHLNSGEMKAGLVKGGHNIIDLGFRYQF